MKTKTTLAILITGLIFLATPMLAAAHGGDRHDNGQKQHKSWSKDKDRHADSSRHNQSWKKNMDRHDSDRYQQNRDHKWDKRAKKQIKRHLRDHHRPVRHVVNYPVRRHVQSYYRNSAVVLGFPRIVFHLDF